MKKPKPNSLEMVSVKRLRWTATTRYNNEQVRRVEKFLETGDGGAKRLIQAHTLFPEKLNEVLAGSKEEAQ